MGDKDSEHTNDDSESRGVDVNDEAGNEFSSDESDGSSDDGTRIPIEDTQNSSGDQNVEEDEVDDETANGGTNIEIEDKTGDSDGENTSANREGIQTETTTVEVGTDAEATKWQTRLVRKKKKIANADSVTEAETLWNEFNSLRDKMLQEGYLNEDEIDTSINLTDLTEGLSISQDDGDNTSSTDETDERGSSEDSLSSDESGSHEESDSSGGDEPSTNEAKSGDGTDATSEDVSPSDLETAREGDGTTAVDTDSENSEGQSTEREDDSATSSSESEDDETTESGSQDSNDSDSAPEESRGSDEETVVDEGTDQKSSQVEANNETDPEVEQLQQTVAELESEIAELKNTFDEYKRRNERQHEYLKKDAIEDLVDRMLNVRTTLHKAIEFYDWDESQVELFESLIREFDQQLTMKDIDRIEPERGDRVDDLRHDVQERRPDTEGVGTNRVLSVETVGFEVRALDGDRYPIREAKVIATRRS